MNSSYNLLLVSSWVVDHSKLWFSEALDKNYGLKKNIQARYFVFKVDGSYFKYNYEH